MSNLRLPNIVPAEPINSFDDAVQFVQTMFEPFVENGRIKFPEWGRSRDVLWERLRLFYVEEEAGEGDAIWADEAAAHSLWLAANEDPDAYDLAREIACRNLRQGNPIPKNIGYFVADVLDGSITKPAKRGTKAEDNFRRDFWLSLAIHLITQNSDILALRTDLPTKKLEHSACDAVSEVFSDLGSPLTYQAAKTVWNRKKPQTIEAMAALVQHLSRTQKIVAPPGSK